MPIGKIRLRKSLPNRLKNRRILQDADPFALFSGNDLTADIVSPPMIIVYVFLETVSYAPTAHPMTHENES